MEYERITSRNINGRINAASSGEYGNVLYFRRNLIKNLQIFKTDCAILRDIK
jgi:hypothetical protein